MLKTHLVKGDNTMIKMLQWILGVAAALGLVLAIIFRLARAYPLTVGPPTLFRFTVACCLASIALSLVELSSKCNVPPGKE